MSAANPGELPDDEAIAWVEGRWDPAMTVAAWWQCLADARLSDARLPEPWGRGWSRPQVMAFRKRLAEGGMLAPPYGMGNFLVAPTLLDHGRPELVSRFVPRILNGQEGWCQLFSEPGAGSDLAGLQTRAVRDGDEWVVTGQKVWTTGGQWADLAILVARTDPGVPKHQGLTYFLIDVRQPGVEIRPLREMTGEAMFNEVFLDGARVPADWVVGDIGDGWRVTNTTLRHERAGIGGGLTGGADPGIPGSVAGHLGRPAGSLVGKPSANQPSARAGFGLLLAEARSRGVASDATVRQHLVDVYAIERITQWHIARMRSGNARTGVDANLAKLRNTGYLHAVRQAAGDVLGPQATLWGPESATGGVLQHHTVSSPAPSIYGGSDQIQRNIIGERGLGLPREPDPFRDLPFDQLRHNPTSR